MEGVGARLGRSSSRYGPATVFTGPVRKWRKIWVPVTPTNTASSVSSNNHHSHHQARVSSNGISSSNGNNNNSSHVLLYKWTPISQSQTTAASNDNKDDGAAVEVEEEQPRRKIKYIPIALMEEQKNETVEEQSSVKGDNDVPTEDHQVSENGLVDRQGLHKSTSDLSLNLNDSEGDEEDPEETQDQ